MGAVAARAQARRRAARGLLLGAVSRFDAAARSRSAPTSSSPCGRSWCRIPYGETRTYGQIAKAIGQPRAARAVGLANNQNPIAIDRSLPPRDRRERQPHRLRRRPAPQALAAAARGALRPAGRARRRSLPRRLGTNGESARGEVGRRLSVHSDGTRVATTGSGRTLRARSLATLPHSVAT